MLGSTPHLALLLILCASLSLACGNAPEVAAAPTDEIRTAVRVEPVVPQALAPSLSISGVVEAQAHVDLAFRVTGFVERFEVDEGDRVEVGDVLAELDLADFERDVRSGKARLARANAHARNASAAFARQQKLRENGTSSERAFDEARSAHDMSRAEQQEARMGLEQAEDHLNKATLRAPISGFVARRRLEPHELANSNVPVLELVQLDRVKVRAGVADTWLGRVAKGGKAFITSPQWGDRKFEGRIARIGVSADRSTRTVPIEIELDNPELAFRPDLVVHIEIPTESPQPHLLVPLASVLRDTRLAPFCFVAEGDAGALRAERREVTLGAVHEDRVIIEAGLARGDRVIVRGQHFLRPGDAVQVAEE
jgi:RND family efflux transporter MFP subunit